MSAQARAAAREHLTAALTANAQDPDDYDLEGIIDYLESVAVGPDLVRDVNPAVLRAAIIARRHRGRFTADTITRELTATTADPAFVHELLMHRCMDEPERMVDVLAALATRRNTTHDRRVMFAAADLIDEVQTTPADLMRELVLHRITRRPDAMTDIVLQLARQAADT